MHRVLPSRSRETPGEATCATGRRLAIRIQNHSDDHREQELQEQHPDAADSARKPESGGAGIGRDSSSQLLRAQVNATRKGRTIQKLQASGDGCRN
jgi:hypothetical protein